MWIMTNALISQLRGLICSLVMAAVFTGCVNDNLADLAKKSATVHSDTTVVASPPDSSSSTTSPAVPATPVTTVTTTTSFSKDIRPILIKYDCAGCHGNSYASYFGVSSLARSGQLYGTMSWAAGYRRMPPSQKPTAAELALLSQWIKEGEQNN
jgi:hypothetical protein